MSIDRYNKAAYRRAIWKEAARLLRERCFPEDGIATDLFCDDTFRAPREVPSEIIQEVLLALSKAELDEQGVMQRFKLGEAEEVRCLTKEVENVPEQPPARKRGRPPKPSGGTPTRA